MKRYARLLDSLGATLRPGADEATLARAEASHGVRFPEDVRAFYRVTDGLVLEDLDLEMLPLSSFGPLAGPLNEGHGYAPFTESNDSNPYAVCCAGPLLGFVVHLYHDNETVLVCRSLGRFLDLVAERQRQVPGATEEQMADLVFCCNSLAGDLAFDRPERTADDARIGDELIRYAERFTPRDVEHHDALRFAAQMFGPGHEAELTRVRGEVEQMQGRLRFLANRADLSTITITATELKNYTPPQPVTLASQINTTFFGSLNALIALGESLLLVAIALVPWLPLIVIALFVAYRSYRASLKAAKARMIAGAAPSGPIAS